MERQEEFIDAVEYTKFRATAASLGLDARLLNDDERLRALFVAFLRTASLEETLNRLVKATNQVCSLVDDASQAPLGTGFLINTNQVLTAAHVRSVDADRIVCRFNNITFVGPSVSAQEVLRVRVTNVIQERKPPLDDDPVTEELLDFSVLELETDAGADPRGFVELTPKRIDLNNDAYLVGHPGGGSEAVFSTGKITKEFNDPTDLVFFHSAPAGDGESGAPVFNGNFDVIGMHRAPGKEKNEGQAVSTSVIHRVMGAPTPIA